MARVETIIVGGGISAGSPFTAGFIPVIVNSDPPLVADSIMEQTSGLITVNGALAVGTVAGDRYRFASGLTTNGSLVIGQEGTVTNLSDRGIAIGNTLTVPASIFSCIAIGFNSPFGTQTNRRFIAIGEGINLNGTGGSKVYAIGTGHACTSGNGAVLIGEGMTISGAQTDIIGIKAEAGVTTSTIGHSDVIMIGGGSSHRSNVAYIGGGSIDVQEFVIGQGDAAGIPPAARTLRFTNSPTGLNLQAGDATIQAPLCTGNAQSARVVFNVGNNLNVSGTTGQLPYAILQLEDSVTFSTIRFMQPSSTTKGVTTEFRTGGTNRLMVGVAGAAGQIIAGSAANESCIRTANQQLLFSLDAGATIHAAFTAAGVLNLNVDRGIRFNNQTDGAGVAAGTLANAPTAGDPAFWLPINIGGTDHYIPCWT